MGSELVSGGCLCGFVRYEARGQPINAGYCHCRMCQRSSGAPVMPWARFPIEAFHYTQGEPQVYRSSARGERRFCPKCGGQIEFRESDSPTSVSVNLGTLDDPNRVEPTFHIWVESRIAWFETADALPRYPEHGPEE